MLADIQHGTIWDAIVSLWVPATIGAAAAVYAAKIARDNRRKLDTGNDRDIGTVVHDNARLLEVLSAQVHTNTAETLDALEASKKVTERLDDWIAESTHVHAELLRRLPPEQKGET